MRTSIALATAAVALVFAAAVSVRAANPAQSEEAAVRKATDGFYQALNAMFTGDVAPMKQVWSHADDVTYMGPDGAVNVGWDKVLGDWQKQASKKLGGEIRYEQINATIGQDLATVECRETGENIVNGKPVRVSIRATNVFRKENGQWKMIGHHTDLLPFLQQ